LPLFARNSLWEDFSEQRDGPGGTALLRLLCGLHGQALPDRAIRLAAQMDQQTRQGLARLKAHADAQEAAEIQQLAESGELAWRAPLCCPVPPRTH
jgi:hypothetical protein